jgi:hypothetical protein
MRGADKARVRLRRASDGARAGSKTAADDSGWRATDDEPVCRIRIKFRDNTDQGAAGKRKNMVAILAVPVAKSPGKRLSLSLKTRVEEVLS